MIGAIASHYVASSPIARVGITAPVESENASSVTVNKPTGVAEGDLLIAQVFHRATGYSTGVPSGWTLIRSSLATTGSFGAQRLEVYTKTAGASEPANYSWTFPSSASRYAAGIVAYRNAAVAGSSIAAENEASASNPDAHPAGAVTLSGPVSGGVLVQMSACAYATTSETSEGWYSDPHLWGDQVQNRCHAQERTGITSSSPYTPPAVTHRTNTTGSGSHAWVTAAVMLAPA